MSDADDAPEPIRCRCDRCTSSISVVDDDGVSWGIITLPPSLAKNGVAFDFPPTRVRLGPMIDPRLLAWQREITYRVMVEGEISTGQLCDLLARMWEDALSGSRETAISEARKSVEPISRE